MIVGDKVLAMDFGGVGREDFPGLLTAIEKGHDLFWCGQCLHVDENIYTIRECPQDSCGADYFDATDGNQCPECNRPFTRHVNDMGCETCCDDNECIKLENEDRFDLQCWIVREMKKPPPKKMTKAEQKADTEAMNLSVYGPWQERARFSVPLPYDRTACIRVRVLDNGMVEIHSEHRLKILPQVSNEIRVGIEER